MFLEDIRVVLSRPEEAGNVGAVCRAMKNMGLRRLRIAGEGMPEPGKNRGAGGLNGEVILARAVHAGEIWEKAEFFDTLEEAVADCTLVIGTTRRKGKHRKSFPLSPAEAAACLAGRTGKAALVFGNERTGLEGEELDLCSLASYIPSDDSFPSLNLSHALQIYAYELFLRLAPPQDPAPGKDSTGGDSTGGDSAGSGALAGLSGGSAGGGALAGLSEGGRWEPLEREALDRLVSSITGSLKELGFYRQRGREEQ
ncbi:MAG: RNA methyltransferase, partial [Spirochaetaceae bacterium]|nr:RNA methyltransferase [Spirochaetaceae bacterium]